MVKCSFRNLTWHKLAHITYKPLILVIQVEEVLTEHPLVAEAAVVGFPHPVKGEGVYAYVILKEMSEQVSEETLREELRKIVKTKISGMATN